MKILHVMHNSQLDTGGKISHNLLLQGLDDTGITNEVISTEEYDGFRTHIMEDHMDVNRLRKRDQLVASEVDRVLGEVDADVLYTSGYYALPGSLLAAEDQDITTVTHYRDYWPCCVNGTLIADDETYHERCSVATILRHNSLKRAPWNLYKWQYLKGLAPLLRGADHTIATSSSVADRLGAWGIEAEVVPNPVQIEQYQGDRDEHDGFVAGFRPDGTARQTADWTRFSAVQSRVLAAGDALAGGATRDGILSRACDTLVDGDAYSGACAFDAPVEGAVSLATAGDVDPPDSVSALAAAAITDEAVTSGDAERDDAPLAVPLSHGGTDHGALVLAPTGSTDARERRALAGLGRRVASTLAAVEWKRLLLADAVLELELQLRAPDAGSLFATVSAELGCELTLNGLVPLDGDSLLYYVSVGDVPAEDALTCIERVAESVRLVAAASDASLLEVTAGGDSFPGELIARGTNVSELTAAQGTVELTCETAPNADVRELVEGVQQSYPETRLVAKREVERSVRTPTEFQQALAERLTDKQRSVLQAAYHAGYFDWPRGSTAEELADSIGVSSPTLHNHLRRAQRKLLAAFFDGEE